jgi:putative sigma-54 modulation protein
MQVNITFRGMDSTESLKAYVKEKIEHVEKYFDRPVEAHAVLSLERYLQHADVTITAGHYVLRGRVKSEDMYKSIDESMDKIERQLRRYRDKLRTAKHRGRDNGAAQLRVRHDVFQPPGPHLEESEEWTQGPTIIRSNEFLVSPMTVEEAVMQMDLLNNDFLVFTNAKTGDFNVVYRRKDGHFGLIEAATGKAAPPEAGRPNGLRASGG